MLIVNADDLGRQREATDNTLSCHAAKRISSTSAMVFMEDSERAAELALRSGIDVGLHINLSEAFSGKSVPATLNARHRKVRRFLKSTKYALILFNPFLVRDFRYVFEAQHAEYIRLYGRPPSHLDGHQHMHLATNVILQHILPAGAKVRRSFSFRPGEKGRVNRWYRAAVDRHLAKRHRTTDYFFSLAHHLSVDRLEHVARLATSANVELMTHPLLPGEFALMMGDGYSKTFSRVQMAGYDAL